MKTKQLGTILPTVASLARADRHADRMARGDADFAAAALAGCERRTVSGELRFYRGDRYAVCRNRLVRWFRVTPQGDFAIRAGSRVRPRQRWK